jgi:hypothetical protein
MSFFLFTHATEPTVLDLVEKNLYLLDLSEAIALLGT